MSMQLNYEPLKKAGPRARRDDLDPMTLVSMIWKKHPHADVEELCRRVNAALEGAYAKYQRCFNDYAVRNHANLLAADEREGLRRKQKTALAEQAIADKEVAMRMDAVMETVKNIVLMELATPFGKPLGDLTGAEGRRLTGWQRLLFAGIGNKRLRDVKSEAELQAAWKLSVSAKN